MKTISLFLIFLLPYAVSAQENALLWEISGNDLEHPSYLFGTIHILCPEDMELSEALHDAFNSTDQLVLELDFDDPQLMVGMQNAMMMTDGSTLSSLLETEEYTLIDTYFKEEIGISLDQVSTVKPFFLYSMLYPKILGCTPASYELSLVEKATSENMEVFGLETMEEQVSFLDKIPQEQMADMLYEGVSNIDSSRNEFNKMVEVYIEEDLESLYEMIKASESDMEGFEQFMLIDRNRTWIKKITEFSNTKSTFFAVGAGHLAGENGVIALLKKEGYTLTPVKQ
jgi:uncharacterized protein